MGTRVESAQRKMLLVAIAAITFAAVGDAAAQSSGVIRGTVRDLAGASVPFVEVSVLNTEIRTTSDVNGRFRLTRVPFGRVELRARRLGFVPSTSIIEFAASAAEPDVELRLVPAPDYLPTVQVTEPRQVYDARLAGFKERSTKGVGHFITRQRLDKLHSYRFSDVLRTVPGVQLRMLRGGGTTVSIRGSSCPPLVFVDGMPANAGVVDLDMFDLGTVEGIEVYGGLSSVPPEFVTGRGSERCGVVAIWSRPYRPKPKAAVAKSSRVKELDSLVSHLSVFSVDQVDTPAALIPGTASPEYPDSLRKEGVPGRVVIELIVKEDGYLDSESVVLISSTHPLFTDAVQQALATAKFRVAKLKSRPVRQILQLPFVFRMENSASNR